jgi:hypothetical protein
MLVLVHAAAQSQWVTAAAAQWTVGWWHDCGVQHCNHHFVGGGNGHQQPDIDAKGVDDGGAIAMCDISCL